MSKGKKKLVWIINVYIFINYHFEFEGHRMGIMTGKFFI